MTAPKGKGISSGAATPDRTSILQARTNKIQKGKYRQRKPSTIRQSLQQTDFPANLAKSKVNMFRPGQRRSEKKTQRTH